MSGGAPRSWTAPVWLRKLHEVAADHRRAPAPPASPTERFQIVAELMAFATARLEEQAAHRGCSVSALRIAYEAAARRLRARA